MLYLFLFLTIQVEMKDIGNIYKIRIGHDGSSQYADWMLEKVRFWYTLQCFLFLVTEYYMLEQLLHLVAS